MEHQTIASEGKIKQKREFTPARRYSFLVGENENSHTAKRRFLPLLQNVYNNPTIEDIEDAFSIEVVTKEFFEQYKELFLYISEHLNKDIRSKNILEKAGTDIPRFTKKLLGQIVFLYFLQKKGWLGVSKNEKWGTGKKDFLQSLYKESANAGKNFFNEYLRYLFYEALARQHGKDNYYEKLKCRIPFLNGGLFEANYEWEKFEINLSNTLFRNNEKVNKTGDIGTGILDVFDRYNFTIREDEPLEKEVAIDPEMLGKVFENMLDIIERKSKGAFYTPREIVHYMCQESLIHYLDNKLSGSAPKTEIEDFVHNGIFYIEHDTRVTSKGRETQSYSYKLPENIRQNADRIDNLLTNIKICDPAIGSGAFPVGLLNELVTLQLVLCSHLSKSYLSQKLNIIGLKPEEYDRNPEKYLYHVKYHNIQKSIYGVDKEESAIDIARLRLWLSLVVDEEDFDDIEALPNLDYKIRCGDSLIGLPKDAFLDFNIKKELETLKNTFFAENNEHRKKELKIKIDRKIKDLLDSAVAKCNIDFDFKVNFSEVWQEKDGVENGGFDIVIGNPPYRQLKWLLNDYSNSEFYCYSKSSDIYCLFFEKNFKLTNREGNGIFITSNKWLRTDYGKLLKSFFINNHAMLNIIDFNGYRVFETATVDTAITMWNKNIEGMYKISVAECDTNGKLTSINFSSTNNLNANDIWTTDIVNNNKTKIKIEKNNKRLSDLSVELNYGILTGANHVFILDEKQRANLIDNDEKINKYIVPILRGQDLEKYYFKFNNHYLLNLHNGIRKKNISPIILDPIEDYFLLNYLEALGEKFKQRGEQGNNWYNLRSCNYIDIYKKPKILYSDICQDSGKFVFDKSGYYTNDTAFMIYHENENYLKFLTGILNSNPANYFYINFYCGGLLGKKGIRYKKEFLSQLPIPEMNDTIIGLVDYLIFRKTESINIVSMFIENIIDACVYELYFPEEVHAAQKGVIEHLQDLKPIDDNMTNKQKLAIINSEFERLYDPYHPVRNNVETIENVEVVRIIKKSLIK
jgi:hypothetical protein